MCSTCVEGRKLVRCHTYALPGAPPLLETLAAIQIGRYRTIDTCVDPTNTVQVGRQLS